ncbi:MAG: DUF642 domain-containing protein [Actinomycetota bacterium]
MLQGEEQTRGDTVEIASAPIIHSGWDNEQSTPSDQSPPADHPRPPDPPGAPEAPTVPFRADASPGYGPLVGGDGLDLKWLKLAAIPVFVAAVAIAGYFAFSSRDGSPNETAADQGGTEADRSDVLILDSEGREASGGVFRPTTTSTPALSSTTERANATTASSLTATTVPAAAAAAEDGSDTDTDTGAQGSTTTEADTASSNSVTSSSAPSTTAQQNQASSTARSATSNSVATTTTQTSTTTTTRATTTTRPTTTTSVVRTQIGLGGFENGPQAAAGSWVNHGAGDQVGPWSVLAPLSRDHASIHGGEGTQGHHVNLGDAGSLEREVTGLVPGTEYQLFFNAAAHHNIGGGQSALARVQIDLAAASFSVSTPSTSSFEQRSVRFTASSETVTLRFSSRGTPQSCCGMIIDDVIVKPI